MCYFFLSKILIAVFTVKVQLGDPWKIPSSINEISRRTKVVFGHEFKVTYFRKNVLSLALDAYYAVIDWRWKFYWDREKYLIVR